MGEAEKLTVKVGETDKVSALLYSADKAKRLDTTLLLAHGAGANQLHSFMRLIADGLAARGFDVMTFNFLYTEQGRSAPDNKAKLESCYRAVIQEASKHKKLKKNRLLIGGKSMGGRIASQVVAEGEDGVGGLVFLGYPLHPPGQPEKLRTEHWQSIKVPSLFVQGTRDPFGGPDELRPHIKKHRLKADIYAIETGDHSFKVQKSAGLTQNEVYENIMNRIAEWAGEE